MYLNLYINLTILVLTKTKIIELAWRFWEYIIKRWCEDEGMRGWGDGRKKGRKGKWWKWWTQTKGNECGKCNKMKGNKVGVRGQGRCAMGVVFQFKPFQPFPPLTHSLFSPPFSFNSFPFHLSYQIPIQSFTKYSYQSFMFNCNLLKQNP